MASARPAKGRFAARSRPCAAATRSGEQENALCRSPTVPPQARVAFCKHRGAKKRTSSERQHGHHRRDFSPLAKARWPGRWTRLRLAMKVCGGESTHPARPLPVAGGAGAEEQRPPCRRPTAAGPAWRALDQQSSSRVQGWMPAPNERGAGLVGAPTCAASFSSHFSHARARGALPRRRKPKSRGPLRKRRADQSAT